MVRARLLAAALLLAACTSDSNVSWVFVSNPSGGSVKGGGGAVVVIRYDSSASAMIAAGGQCLSFRGIDAADETVTVHLPVRGDCAVIARAGSVELRSPVLPERVVMLDGARVVAPAGPACAIAIEVRDAFPLDAHLHGPGRVHVASGGTAVFVEARDGLVVLEPDRSPEVFDGGARLDASAATPSVRLADGRALDLVLPPLPAPDRRIDPSTPSDRVALLGPDGERLALLPRERVALHGGAGGVFMTASFPDGIGPSARGLVELTMAEHNRYLLRIDAR